jgi:hypothetical protein
MLIDDVKNGMNGLKGQIFWLGYETRLSDFEVSGDWNQKEIAAHLAGVFAASTPYDCKPLAPLLDKQWGGKRIRFIKDCFGPLPPFPVTCIEMQLGTSTGLLLLQSSAVSEPPRVRDYFLIENALARDGQPGVGRVAFKDEAYTLLTDARWMVSASVLVPMANTVTAFIDNFLAYFCDSRGQLLTSPIANEQLNVRLNKRPQDRMTVAMEKLMEIGLQYFSQATAVLNLMACKNVSSMVRPVDAKLQAARARKGKPPLTEHRVLTVTLPGKANRGERCSADAQLIMANAGEPLPLQTIPGQYRDYRENGLFGKYRGIFWVPAHARGTAEAGEVTKSYRAKPGQEKGVVPNENNASRAQ